MGGNSSAFRRYPPGQFAKANAVINAPEGDSMACFVTKDFSMEGRMQKQFKMKYGGLEWLKDQNKNVGEAVVVDIDGVYIYYLIVKTASYTKATNTDLRAALDDAIVHAELNSVGDISFPADVYSEISSTVYTNETDAAFNGKTVTYTFRDG